MKKSRVLTVLLACLLMISLAHAGRLPNPKKVPFEEAVTMLNTPRLVQSWLYRYLRFDTKKLKMLWKKYGWAKTDEEWTSKEAVMWKEDINYPSETYYSKKGVCIDVGNFAAYCLHEAGHEVTVLSSKYTSSKSKVGFNTHTVCAFKSKKNGKWYIAGDTRKIKKGTELRGPYSSLKEAAEELATEKGGKLIYYFLGRKKFEGDTKFPGVQINGEKPVLSKDR